MTYHGLQYFKYRQDVNGRISIKEEINKSVKGEQVSLSILLGIDDKFAVSSIGVFNKNVCYDISDITGVYNDPEFLKKLKLQNTPIYYPLDKLVYICQVGVVLVEDMIVNKTLKIFCPFDFYGSDNLVCKDVTNLFPYPVREALLDKLSLFALQRAL